MPETVKREYTAQSKSVSRTVQGRKTVSKGAKYPAHPPSGVDNCIKK